MTFLNIKRNSKKTLALHSDLCLVFLVLNKSINEIYTSKILKFGMVLKSHRVHTVYFPVLSYIRVYETYKLFQILYNFGGKFVVRMKNLPTSDSKGCLEMIFDILLQFSPEK